MSQRAGQRTDRKVGAGRRRSGWAAVVAVLALGISDPAGARAEEPAVAGAIEPDDAAMPRIVLSPEQREQLRLAREVEARKLLGLAPDAPLPTAAELTDAQRETIRAARAAEMRRVLGLGPDEPIPDRASATPEQRRKIVAAHEARLREALGLAPDAPLPTAPAAAEAPNESAPPANPGGAQ